METHTGSKKALVIYGPTTTGKTDLALNLARHFNGELISADSRQIYRGLDIGTGKVNLSSKVEKHKGFWVVDGVKIHGFDLVEPLGYEPVSRDAIPGHETGSSKVGSRLESGSEPGTFSVANFLNFANNSMIRIIELGKMPIIVGGTGFYIKSLLKPIDSLGVLPDPKLRKSLEKLSTEQLYTKLKKLNAPKAKSMNPSDSKNPRRLIRAIEVSLDSTKQTTNTKYQILNTKYTFIGLTAPNAYLYSKTDTWLQKRLDNGLVEEVDSLIKSGVSPKWLESLGLEYRWVTRLLTSHIDKEEAIVRLKGDTHNFVRHQKTYFLQFEKITKVNYFDISKNNWQNKLEKTIRLCYTQTNGRRQKRN